MYRKTQVKSSACWVIACNVGGTYILKMESITSIYKDMKYPIKISLIGTGYTRCWAQPL